MRRFIFGLAIVLLATCGTAKADEPQILRVEFRSPSLSAFWREPINIEASVLLPDTYYRQPDRRYPVIYWIPEFDANDLIDPLTERRWQRAMRQLHFEAIVVVMGVMFNGVAQEFADSANDGPWGTAFTREFVPDMDSRFRTLPSAEDRFLAGHSSGGWASLWLQVNYPELFGGVWSISPDPVDFQSFCGPDLALVSPGNFYHDAEGRSYVLHDVDGQQTYTLQELTTTSLWGPAQFNSFEIVFSPRGANGKAERLFDRWSGAIDPKVAAYWEQHYDIARVIGDNWETLSPQLQGKLHIIVGDDDNFRLNESVALLGAELRALGSDAEIDFAPGADHWTVMDWNGGVIAYMLREIAQRK